MLRTGSRSITGAVVVLILQACGEVPTAPDATQGPLLSKANEPQFVDLAPPGSSTSWAVGVNQKGQVAGYYYVPGNWTQRGFLWEKGTFTDLGQFVPTAINDNGQMVGNNSADYQPYLWDRGVLTSIPCSGNAINKKGHVAGSYLTSGYLRHGCLWRDGVLTDIPSLTPDPFDWEKNFAIAYGINDNDEVVGQSALGRPFWSPAKAFRFANGVLTDLGTAYPGNLGEAWARAINNKGQVTGDATNSAFSTVPFIWADGTMTSIGAWPAGFVRALGISDKGEVVGQCQDGILSTARSFPCVWQDGAPMELPTAPYVSRYSYAVGIDSKGKYVAGSVAGYGILQRAVVWVR